MAGLFDSVKGLSPDGLGKPPGGSPTPTSIPIIGPDWGQGKGNTKLTPQTASKSAASVIR